MDSGNVWSRCHVKTATIAMQETVHANISTTMNIYTKALISAKREAQSRVVDLLLDRSWNVVESAAQDAA